MNDLLQHRCFCAQLRIKQKATNAVNVVNAASPMTTKPVSSLQRRRPGREDLRHGRHRQQRGSGPGQHGDLRPQHQRLDSPAVATLSALQTRLRRHQKVHSERLTAPGRQPIPAELRGFGDDGRQQRGTRPVGPQPLDLMPATLRLVDPTNTTPPRLTPFLQPHAECTHIQLPINVTRRCLTSGAVCATVVDLQPTHTGTLLVNSAGYPRLSSVFSRCL